MRWNILTILCIGFMPITVSTKYPSRQIKEEGNRVCSPLVYANTGWCRTHCGEAKFRDLISVSCHLWRLSVYTLWGLCLE